MNGTMSTHVGLGAQYQLDLLTTSLAWTGARDDGAASVMASVMGSQGVGRVVEDGGLRVEHSMRLGVFPSPLEVAEEDEGRMRLLCRVGYRSGRLKRLGQRFAYEGLEAAVEALLVPASPTPALYGFLLSLEGFGPFAAANATQLAGRFDTQPFDSETVRHMREYHGVDRQFKKTSAELLQRAREHYTAERYRADSFLVYWWEVRAHTAWIAPGGHGSSVADH